MVETITRLMEKMVTMEPILMTVTAEEVETAVTQYPALSTDIIVAFVLVDSDLPLPKFVYEKFVVLFRVTMFEFFISYFCGRVVKFKGV